MYRIQDSNNRFIKKTVDNKITFTYSKSLADIFPSEREANDFLRKMFSKKARKKYRAVKSENDSFSSVCESEDFHIIGESVFIGNEIGAEHFLKSFITRIPFVDCIVVPDIRTITSNPRNAFEVVDKLQNEGVDLFTMMDDRFSKATSTISVLRAYRQCNKTCKCE